MTEDKGHTMKLITVNRMVGASGKGREAKGELVISNFKPSV